MPVSWYASSLVNRKKKKLLQNSHLQDSGYVCQIRLFDVTIKPG